MQDEFVIYYELTYSINKDRIKKFITLDLEEAKLKTSEVLQDATSLHFQFQKVSSTRAEMLSALKKATLCI